MVVGRARQGAEGGIRVRGVCRIRHSPASQADGQAQLPVPHRADGPLSAPSSSLPGLHHRRRYGSGGRRHPHRRRYGSGGRLSLQQSTLQDLSERQASLEKWWTVRILRVRLVQQEWPEGRLNLPAVERAAGSLLRQG